MAHQWDDLQDWLLEGEDGPCYQLKKLDELWEEVSERGLPEELEEEIAGRRQSLQEGWDQFVRLIEAVELASARQAYQEKRRTAEVKGIQEAINARLAMSLGCRNKPN